MRVVRADTSPGQTTNTLLTFALHLWHSMVKLYTRAVVDPSKSSFTDSNWQNRKQINRGILANFFWVNLLWPILEEKLALLTAKMEFFSGLVFLFIVFSFLLIWMPIEPNLGLLCSREKNSWIVIGRGCVYFNTFWLVLQTVLSSNCSRRFVRFRRLRSRRLKVSTAPQFGLYESPPCFRGRWEGLLRILARITEFFTLLLKLPSSS